MYLELIFVLFQLFFFQELFGVFSNRSYDSLDPRDLSFINDYENFKTRTFELDRKLGAVLVFLKSLIIFGVLHDTLNYVNIFEILSKTLVFITD
jgi:hypothetical protein